MKTKAIGKITVRHYLNTNLKPYIVDGDELYKLYFLVRYQNKNTKLKSFIDVELTEKEYSSQVKNQKDDLSKRIKNEKLLVQKTIETVSEMGLPFEIKLFTSAWGIATYPIIKTFERRLKHYENLVISEDGDSFLYDNLYTFEKVLKSLKYFVSNSKHSITDELFLMQFLDKEVIKDYKAGLNEKEQTHILYIPEKRREGNTIITDYREKEVDNVAIIKALAIYNSYYSYSSTEKINFGNFEFDYEGANVRMNLSLDEKFYMSLLSLMTDS